jgi:hypothetical protein
MMKLTLERDQARSMEQYFLPLMLQLAKQRIKESAENVDEQLNCRVIYALIIDVKFLFTKKLMTRANSFTFNFTDAEGITFYKMLLNHPIEEKQFYLDHLRNWCILIMNKQLLKPVNEVCSDH